MELEELRVVPRDVPPELSRRIAVASAIVLLAFVGIVVRLVSLQVVQGAEMRSLSEHNRIRLVRVPAARGVVYDRNGELLIDNRPSFDVVYVPEDARGRPGVLRTLATRLNEREDIVRADQPHRHHIPCGFRGVFCKHKPHAVGRDGGGRLRVRAFE